MSEVSTHRPDCVAQDLVETRRKVCTEILSRLPSIQDILNCPTEELRLLDETQRQEKEKLLEDTTCLCNELKDVLTKSCGVQTRSVGVDLDKGSERRAIASAYRDGRNLWTMRAHFNPLLAPGPADKWTAQITLYAADTLAQVTWALSDELYPDFKACSEVKKQTDSGTDTSESASRPSKPPSDLRTAAPYAVPKVLEGARDHDPEVLSTPSCLATGRSTHHGGMGQAEVTEAITGEDFRLHLQPQSQDFTNDNGEWKSARDLPGYPWVVARASEFSIPVRGGPPDSHSHVSDGEAECSDASDDAGGWILVDKGEVSQ